MQIVTSSQMALNADRVERLTRRANELADQQRLGIIEKAMRIARAREPSMMQVLEQCAEIMGQINEEQHGETQRRASHKGTSMGVQATDTTLWQEAYRLADQGEPSIHFGWLYAAAAERAGFPL